ncbi:hypothetical protein RRF57_010735 [Xylaria bambusicola]|uniref:Uncharacterized protein n=1 Tax=Xylaria bambusicola TaxID=326684 RepID=A0AAN7USW7_9PEZI
MHRSVDRPAVAYPAFHTVLGVFCERDARDATRYLKRRPFSKVPCQYQLRCRAVDAESLTPTYDRERSCMADRMPCGSNV